MSVIRVPVIRMPVIRRGLLALILVAPLALAASVASAPTSRADATCNGSGASVSGGAVETYVCLTIDKQAATPKQLSETGGGQPLVCWLEPQYTPAQLDALITNESSLPIGVVGSEGGQYYQQLLKNYGPPKPNYNDGQDGYWWGVGCDITNLNANTYMENLWAAVGLDVYHPWEWVPNENIPAGPPDEVANAQLLSYYARESAPLDEPTGDMSPKYSGGTSTQTVGLPTYFWGTIGPAAAPVVNHEIEATVQGWDTSGPVIATPETVTITTTGTVQGSSTIQCPVTNGEFGTAYSSTTTMPADCSFTYTQPSNDITLTMVTNWKITWAGKDGFPGWTVDENSATVTFGGIKVQEVQTINNG